MGVWNLLGISTQSKEFRRPWILCKELHLPEDVHLDVVLLMLWQIWKARNALIFDRKTSLAGDVIRRVINDMDSWSCRYKKTRPQWNCWCDFLCSRL
uniref:Uncharacterized protein n=1 Tax=Setaria viridis TaxID=4556 RepID=A0A4U6TX19_SETVI|nr:hypothetical protein SEVIR_7G312532v2 [Setaria viridis]